MACEINSLASTKRQLAAAKSQADELIPVLKALEQLYAKLADSSTAWSTDLVQQESEFRQSRHQHYLDLQQTMDEQYAELRRDSVHMRVANAERSFKRDLDSYVQNQSSPRQRSHTNVPRAAAAPENWAGGSCADQDFFGDSDEAGLKSLGTIKQRPKSGTMPSAFGRLASRQGKPAKKGKGFSAAARANYKDGDEAKIFGDDDDDEHLGAESRMGFVVLGDEDFSGT
ncbi:hypothetical protein BX661DRAFT_45757 [Kickxella alabastrina]|uniref:uncharacterized protein n=1 Tax=Kickxella alabastrina TaxID=61397 RepID=UPI002220DBD9|nr:uncharacterized protein BX661DRAFT_45757 [Kickxella alabastrina]KAI7824186.1 hypothetical protein BX661DRAFT_45757 [Kickxella alabastrina]KAJ1935010.1 hypothetical protein GGF37_006157 [Kickxella alabastrina]